MKFIFLLVLLMNPLAEGQELKHGDIHADDALVRMNLPADATPTQIKSQYRKLAKKYHPDLAVDAQKEQFKEIFQQLSEAYECLSDDGFPGRSSIAEYKAFKKGRISSGKSNQTSSSAADLKPGSFPMHLLAQTDEATHLARSKKFVQMFDQFFVLRNMPARPELQIPKKFKKFLGAFGGNDGSWRTAWLTVFDSIDDQFASPVDARTTADAFVAMMIKRGQIKFLTDMNDAQVKKMFQLLYTSEPRVAWLALTQKVRFSAVLDVEQANRLVLFALANAKPESVVDQNAISMLFNDYALVAREVTDSNQAFLRTMTDVWDMGRTIDQGLTLDRLQSRFSEFVPSTYTMSRSYKNLAVEKRVLGPVIKSLKTVAPYSSRVQANFAAYVKNNEVLREYWHLELVKVQALTPVAASGNSIVVRNGLEPIDTLDDYFQSLQSAKMSLTECIYRVFGRVPR